MHSHSAQLTLKGQKQGDFGKFEVQDFRYNIMHPIDSATGMIAGKIQGNVLEVEIDIDPKTLMILQAVSTNETIEGDITFFKPDVSGQEATFMKITIKEARCYSLTQVFSSSDTLPMRISLKISSPSLEFTADSITANYVNDYANS